MNKGLKIFLIATGVALAMGAWYNVMSANRDKHQPKPTSSTESTRYKFKWRAWDGEHEMPNADIVVRSDHASGNPYYGYGNITGVAFNHSSEDYSYVQLTFGLYNENKQKFGTCLANMNSLRSGQTWAFDATCTDWQSNTSYMLEDVSFF